MPCCGAGQRLTFTPVVWEPPTVGAAGFAHVQFTGADPVAQFGRVTGSYYPFQEQAVLWVDVRDLPFLREVVSV